ncbi:MAG: hypothetical protein QOI36_4850, partial [Pseudonocardiales bacterium]|nr:hypothetical protein [Pseudonocardiales bacterium]
MQELAVLTYGADPEHIDATLRRPARLPRRPPPAAVAVLGATGPTGRAFVDAALRRGHTLTAVVRGAGRLDSTPDLRVVEGDARTATTVEAAVRGQDAVFVSLGLSAGGSAEGGVTVCTDAVRHLVRAMPRLGVSRAIVMSTHGVGDSNDGSPYVRRVWELMGDRLQDKETMEAVLGASDLDWTVVRGAADHRRAGERCVPRRPPARRSRRRPHPAP